MLLKTECRDKITKAKDIAKIMQALLQVENEIDRDKEHFWSIGLKTNNMIKYIELVTLGLLDQTIIAPRELFRMAISQGVKHIIIVHNHPSGELTPSNHDARITKELKDAGKIIDIPILDHVIITQDSYFSFNDKGLM